MPDIEIKKILSQKSDRWVMALALLVFLIFFLADYINGRFWLNDFKVMYSAAKAVANGAQLYGIPFGLGSGFFKYTPVVSLFFLPATWFSFETAAVLHFILMAVVSSFLLLYLKKVFFNNIKPAWQFGFVLLLLAIAGRHFFREFHLGNVNLLLLALIVLGIHALVQKQELWGALCLVLVIFIKPYFVVLGLPLLLTYRWKTIGYMALWSLAILLVGWAYFGSSLFLDLHKEWWGTVQAHNANFSSSEMLYSLLNQYLGWETSPNYSLVFVALSIVVCTALYFRKKSDFNLEKERNDFVWKSSFLLSAWVPSLLITDSQHFLFSLPLWFMVLSWTHRQQSWVLWAFVGFIGVLYGGNQIEILGKANADFWSRWGFLGISNLLLIGLATYITLGSKLLASSSNHPSSNN